MFFMGAVGVLLILLLIGIFCFGIPLLIGIFVYKDANKRVDCTPWLWAIVAALVPSFIGLVIYLIIRNDYPLKVDYSQSAAAGGSDMSDDAVQGNGSNQEAGGRKGLPGWAKVLIVIVTIVVALCIIAVAISVAYSIITGTQSCNPTPYIGDMY